MLNGSIYILSIAMYIGVFVRTKILLALHRKTEGEGCNKITVLGDITPSHRGKSLTPPFVDCWTAKTCISGALRFVRIVEVI